MASILGLQTNISYLTIPGALFLALLPRVYSGFTGPGKQYLDKNNPRTFYETLGKADLDKKTKNRLQRAESAVANAFETLGLYAAAVTAGNAAGLSTEIMNSLSIGYLTLRVFYTWIYIWGQENRKFAPLRTLVWGAHMALVMSMFVMAGWKA
ncbi:hypothetical protein F5B20DRAFT_363931 [Whalleya microplaca]|nr:hypothetical protein F5B20DRAFT_363931 [Whalleya microplaca]